MDTNSKIMVALSFVITFLIGAIYYLRDHISDLVGEVGRLKSEKQLGETVAKMNEAKETADAEEDKFNSMYNSYKSKSGDSTEH